MGNKNYKKIGIFLFVTFTILSLMAYFYIYKSHRNIEQETSEYKLKAKEFINEFQLNDSISTLKYADKTIEVTGIVTTLNANNKSLIIDNNLFVVLKDSLKNRIKTSKKVTIKGRFVGYDDLFGELKMDQCLIIE